MTERAVRVSTFLLAMLLDIAPTVAVELSLEYYTSVFEPAFTYTPPKFIDLRFEKRRARRTRERVPSFTEFYGRNKRHVSSHAFPRARGFKANLN